MIDPKIIDAALATKGFGKGMPGYPKVKDATIDGGKIIIALENGQVIEVWVASLPEGTVPTGPKPETTTLIDPKPTEV